MNPFSKSQEKHKYKERSLLTAFIVATYFILLCAFAIFGNIIWNGAPVLWQKGFSFLFKEPQTLVVAEIGKSDNIQTPLKNYNSFLRSNPKIDPLIQNPKEIQKSFSFTQFQVEPGSIIGEGYLKELELQNKGFFLRYDKRDFTTPVAFVLDNNTKFDLEDADFKKLKALEPSLIPHNVATREVKPSKFEVTIAQGEYPIGKSAHDALVPTPLIFQMRQTFADDDAGQIYQTIIPETQTITVNSSTYYAVFDEDERGTLPLQSQKRTHFLKNFYTFTLPKGVYTVSPEALKIISTKGATSMHMPEKGSIVFNNDKPTELTVPTALFKTIKAANPAFKTSNAKEFTKQQTYVDFSLSKDTEILLDVDDYEAFTKANKTSGNFNTLSEKTHSYSGGGVLGPIVGTALLVIICMVIALFTGIATSIYLNEYASKGGFIKAIRLAMLNLAGVPSIVFGLFGLGLFVILAPTITSTPNAESKLIIPIAPIASEPGAREVEERKIFVAEQPMEIKQLKASAATNGDTLFYDGWSYLSLQGWGTCMLAGGFTLAIMVLPVIITSCEESLSAVPMGFREASLALGATKWQSIRTSVLPYAFPGILTASILGITRVAGETAPIMFTAAVAARSSLPWEGLHATGFDRFVDFLQQSVQALPYHIYTVAGRIPQSEYTRPMQYGSVLVFMLIVMTFAAFSVWLRIRIRNKIKW